MIRKKIIAYISKERKSAIRFKYLDTQSKQYLLIHLQLLINKIIQ